MISFESTGNVGIQTFLCITCVHPLVMYASLWLSTKLEHYHKCIIFITFACVLIWLIMMFRYNNLMCLLWLTSVVLLWLWVCRFGKAHLCEVSNLGTMFTLILLSWAIKSLCMWGITTSGTLVRIFSIW